MKKVYLNADPDLFHTEPGYVGAFTRAQVKGAIKNGSVVEKIKEEKGDTHKIGERAIVLGSMQAPGIGIMYFIEWISSPGYAVACIYWKLKQVLS